jgi:hypothetical protein
MWFGGQRTWDGSVGTVVRTHLEMGFAEIFRDFFDGMPKYFLFRCHFALVLVLSFLFSLSCYKIHSEMVHVHDDEACRPGMTGWADALKGKMMIYNSFSG